MLRVLMEKVENMQVQADNVNKEIQFQEINENATNHKHC